MTRLTEMVVTKGRTVMHDGKTYGQHSRISLPPNEAIRLEQMGFVLAVSVVRGLLQDPDNSTGAVVGGSAGDGPGAAGDDSAGDGTGATGDGSAGDGPAAAGEGSAGDDAGTVTGKADAKNTTGKNAKKTGA